MKTVVPNEIEPSETSSRLEVTQDQQDLRRMELVRRGRARRRRGVITVITTMGRRGRRSRSRQGTRGSRSSRGMYRQIWSARSAKVTRRRIGEFDEVPSSAAAVEADSQSSICSDGRPEDMVACYTCGRAGSFFFSSHGSRTSVGRAHTFLLSLLVFRSPNLSSDVFETTRRHGHELRLAMHRVQAV